MTENPPDQAADALQAKVVALESANAELAARLDAADAEPPQPARRRSPGRAVLAVVLIVIGSLLAPVAIVTGWSRVLLTDTDAFVATFAPLARDPHVQAFITDEVVDAVNQRLDLNTVVGDVVDGLAEALNRPRLTVALQLLEQPAVDGLQSAIRTATDKVVTSDAFGIAWDQALSTSHTQAVAALTGDPNALIAVSTEGLGVQLGPIVARVKDRLIAQGFALASRIPDVDKVIVISDGAHMAQLQLAYRAAVAMGYWLPLVVLLLLVGGVLAAVRRHRAAIWAAVGLGLGAVLIGAALVVGRSLVATSVPSTTMPPDVARLFFDTATGALSDLAWVTLMLAVLIGLIAWFSGPFAPARQVRTGYTGLVQKLRNAGDAQGLSTGRVGEWVYAQRFLLRALIGAGAAVYLLMNRPLESGSVLGCAVVCLVILLILSLIQRPVVTVPAPPVDTALPPTVG